MGGSRKKVKTGEDRHSAQDVVSSTKEVTESRGAQRGEKGPFCLHTWGVPSSPLPAQTLLGFDSSLHLTPTHPSTVSYLLFSPQGTAGSQHPGPSSRAAGCKYLGCNLSWGLGHHVFSSDPVKCFPLAPLGATLLHALAAPLPSAVSRHSGPTSAQRKE